MDGHLFVRAYRAKYAASRYMTHMIGPGARAATVETCPLELTERFLRPLSTASLDEIQAVFVITA